MKFKSIAAAMAIAAGITVLSSAAPASAAASAPSCVATLSQTAVSRDTSLGALQQMITDRTSPGYFGGTILSGLAPLHTCAG